MIGVLGISRVGGGEECYFAATAGKQSYRKNQNPLAFHATKNAYELGADYGTC